MEIREVARNFWKNREKYPDYPYVLKRRLMDVTHIAPLVQSARSILDIGCADGYMLVALREFTDISKFYAYDLSENLLNILKNKWGTYRFLETKAIDILSVSAFPPVDVTLSLGSFPYIFDDSKLRYVISQIQSNLLIVRTPCSVTTEREVVNKYSEDLGETYASVYRTVDEYVNILAECYDVKGIFRAYPDEIESKYGTKQYFFVCERN